MAIAEELQVIIRAETQNAVRNLQQFQKASGTAEKSATSFAKSLVAGAGAAAAAYLSFRALTGLVSSSIKAYQEQEKQERLLASAIESTGGNVDALLPRYKALASQVQRVTTVGNEQVLGLIRLARSYGLQGKQVDEATKGAIGLSKAFGIDVQTALRGVSNAYQGNFEQLSRYIPALRNAGTESEKMAALQKAMADGFGIAEAEAKTSTGQMQQLKNATGDLLEIVGEGFATKASPFITWLRDSITNLTEGISKSRTYAQVQKQLIEGKFDEVKAVQLVDYYQNKIAEADRQIANWSDKAFRQNLMSQGVSEDMLDTQLRQFRLNKQNAEEGLKRASQRVGKENLMLMLEEKKAEAAKRSTEAIVKQAEALKLGAGYAADMVDNFWGMANVPESTFEPPISIDDYAAHMAAMEMENAHFITAAIANDRAASESAKQAAAEIAAAYSAAYSVISSGVMELWSMQLQQNRQSGDAAVKRLEKEREAFRENYEQELRLKESLGIDTVAFQEEMNARQAALDEAVLQRQNAIKKKMFEQEKKLSIAQTIMSGAEAAIKAYSQLGAFGAPVAALIAAFTAAKVGMIQSQKYPALAEGGIVQPTPGGSLVRVAEAGKPEAIVPLDKGFGNITVVINAEVVGDREAVSMWVHEGIARARKMGRI